MTDVMTALRTYSRVAGRPAAEPLDTNRVFLAILDSASSLLAAITMDTARLKRCFGELLEHHNIAHLRWRHCGKAAGVITPRTPRKLTTRAVVAQEKQTWRSKKTKQNLGTYSVSKSIRNPEQLARALTSDLP